MLKLLIAATHRFPLWRIPDWLPPRVQARFPEIQVVHLPGYEGIDREIADADIYVGFILRPESLACAQRLRWIHATAAGVDQLCYPEMLARDITITNSSSVMAEPTAEHTMALILSLAKRIPSAVRYQQEAVWGQTLIAQEQPAIQELSGATLGIVGLGAIGQELVKRARPFGMRVIAVKRDITTGTEWADRLFPPSQLNDMLAEADYVVLAAPNTDQTRRLIGAPQLAAMKPTAYLINIGRGTLLDDAALVHALESRKVAGAAADVFEPEPLPADSPLWKAPNMLITPHLAATTERLWKRHVELIEENIHRYLIGQPLRNVVDKQAGY